MQPSFPFFARSEVLRRIKKKYLSGKGGRLLSKFTEGDIDLNWETIARLAELSYRCTICRRCTQACSRGVDNGLITHELRKLFSQEMGIAAKELHDSGRAAQIEFDRASTALKSAQAEVDRADERTHRSMAGNC